MNGLQAKGNRAGVALQKARLGTREQQQDYANAAAVSKMTSYIPLPRPIFQRSIPPGIQISLVLVPKRVTGGVGIYLVGRCLQAFSFSVCVRVHLVHEPKTKSAVFPWSSLAYSHIKHNARPHGVIRTRMSLFTALQARIISRYG